jgi:MtfA peptidase
MIALLLVLAITLAAMYGIYLLPVHRLRRALAQPFPKNYSRILRKNIPVFSRLPADLQLQLKQRIKQFLLTKQFIGCDGLRVTDEMRVTIAGRACLLLLNRPTGVHAVYPELKHVLIYPSAFVVPRTEGLPGGVVSLSHQSLAGESWNDGRVILAWDCVQKRSSMFDDEAFDGHDVVLHEFAHQLDATYSRPHGAPVLPTTARYARWSEVMQREYALLQQAAELQLESVLDYYGATDPAEFFAVATEAFFERTAALADSHPELHEQLRLYYRVDPRDWN